VNTQKPKVNIEKLLTEVIEYMKNARNHTIVRPFLDTFPKCQYFSHVHRSFLFAKLPRW
jgi:hypothetical protein